MKQFKVENFQVKNIYFSSHTWTKLTSKGWNGKNTVQTTSKTIFTNLNSYFDIKLYALVNIDNFVLEKLGKKMLEKI